MILRARRAHDPRLRRVVRTFGALCVAQLAACALAGAAAAAQVLTGIADQRSALFDSPPYRALELNTVRLVVPWDAADRAGPWHGWIQRAIADGASVQIALEHEPSSRCPQAPCTLPSREQYGDALAALLAMYPAVREIAAWNEPNHSSQPTFRDPAAAAGYYDEARARCPSCVVVAGDFLDDVALADYLSAYRAALTSPADVWGLHNYYDATYFRSRGVTTMLANTTGALWLTETGGIVSFTPPGGGGLPYDEQRAADSVAWLYELADANARITRMYLYQWQGAHDNAFDSGLLGYDGTPRPAYAVVAARVGPRGGVSPAAPDGEPAPDRRVDAATGSQHAPRATLRGGWRLRLLSGRRLVLQVRCVVRGGASRCRKRLVVRVTGTVVARLQVDVAAFRTTTRVVRLPRWAAAWLRRSRARRVELQTCAPAGSPCTSRASVRVALSRGRDYTRAATLAAAGAPAAGTCACPR